MSYSIPIPFGPEGCLADQGRCAEKDTLSILQRFNQVYRDKLRNMEANGENLEAKVNLQDAWIRDLTRQVELLVKAVEELELEATQKVIRLEQALKAGASKEVNKKVEITTSTTVDAKKEAATVEKLQQSMLDMRDALTAEVANKHDVIINLRREVQSLEKECVRANKRTQFKEDVIMDLRMEIKQLKQKASSSRDKEYEEYKKNLEALAKENAQLNKKVVSAKDSDQVLVTKPCPSCSCIMDQRQIEKLKAIKSDSTIVPTLSPCQKKLAELFGKVDHLMQQLKECKSENKLLQIAIDTLRKEKSDKKMDESRGKQLTPAEEVKDVSTLAERVAVDEIQTAATGMKEQTDAIMQLESQDLQEEQTGTSDREPEEPQETEESGAPTCASPDTNFPTSGYDSSGQSTPPFTCGFLPQTVQSTPTCGLNVLFDRPVETRGSCSTPAFLSQPSTCLVQGEVQRLTCIAENALGNRQASTVQTCQELLQENLRLLQANEDLKHQLKELRERLEVSPSMDGCSKFLPKSLSDTDTNITPTERLQQENVRLKQQIKDLQKELNKLKGLDENVSPVPDSASHVSLKESSVEVLRNQNQQLRQVVQRLKAEQQVLLQTRQVNDLGGQRGKTSISCQAFTEASAELQTIINQLARKVCAMKSNSEHLYREEFKELEDGYDRENSSNQQEIRNLRQCIEELEDALLLAHEQVEELKNTVNHYINYLSILESYDEIQKEQILHQQLTIHNLQEALLGSKRELAELQKKSAGEVQSNLLIREQMCEYLEHSNNLAKKLEYLQEYNLDLEVEKFGFIQDVAIMESRLLKYQQLCSVVDKDCTCKLQEELDKAKESNMHLEAIIKNTSIATNEQIQLLAEESNKSKEVITTLEDSNNDLNTKIEALQTELEHERTLNRNNLIRIEELHQMSGEKMLDLSRYEEALQEAEERLQEMLSKRNESKQCSCQVSEEEEEIDLQSYQIEMDSYREQVDTLKEKIALLTHLLEQKDEELEKLQVEYKKQGNALIGAQRDFEGINPKYEGDIMILKHTIDELNDKLLLAESNYKSLNDDYVSCQTKIRELEQVENEHQKELAEKQREISSQLNEVHNECLCQAEFASQLEEEVINLRGELDGKQQELDSALMTIAELEFAKSSLQGELCKAKSELVQLHQEQIMFNNKNEKLLTQMTCICNDKASIEEQNTLLGKELNECLEEMQLLQHQKKSLEDKIEELQAIVKQFENAYADIKRDYNETTQSLLTVEMELMNTRTTRDDLCVESRIFMNNVRAWLREQELIDQHLKRKLTENNQTIGKLKEENESLLSRRKHPCAARQRGGCSSGPNRVGCENYSDSLPSLDSYDSDSSTNFVSDNS